MTDPASWMRIEELLDELLELAPEERASRLERLSGTDRSLRPQIERLLAADAEDGPGILDAGLGPLAGHVLEDDGDAVAAGERIGPYRVLRELGRGGMGEVLLAERAAGGFDQLVALKIIRRGLDRAEIVERFRHERNILARLRHPHIATLHDGGATDEGVPYFAMEYVDGKPIHLYCDEERLGVDERIDLFDAVCRAVQYAHRNLVVHRDLKPSNVLVTADGTVKLLDFGIAKVVDAEADGADRTQRTGRFLTPAYAAPEQVAGEPTSTATDVYSLGVLLYVLLTGHNPHGDTFRSVELARAILETEAPDPSSRAGRDTANETAAEIARLRRTVPSELRRRIRGDLDNILRKALQKRPEDRYASVEDLRADLERHRRSLPVEARAPTARYRLGKFVRRHRMAVAAGAVAALALVAGVVGVAWQGGVAARERDRARQEATRAGAVKDYLVEVFSAADPQYESGEALTALELVERGASRIGARFEDDPAVHGEITRVLASVLNGLGRYDRADTVLSAALPEIRGLGDPEGLYDALRQLHAAALGAGANDTALVRAREMLDLSRRAFGEDDERTLDSREAIALSLQGLGRLDEAGALFDDLLAEATRRRADSSPDLARLQLNYGTFLYETGDYAGAEERARAAAEGYRAAHDAAHEVEALGALGDILGMQDRPDEALEVLREAVAAARIEYGEGDGHPALAGCLVNLGGVLRNLGRYREAEAAFREGADMYVATLGGDHWMVGRAYVNLANAKTGLGDLEGAGRLLDEAVRIMAAALGENHPALGAPLTQRARNLLDRGLLDEAESAYRETLAMHRASFGDEHPYTSYPAEGLAGTLEQLGRLEEAEALRREVVEIRTAAFGPSHSVTVGSRTLLALVVARRGRLDEAARELDGAAEDARKGLPSTAAALSDVLLERARLGRRRGQDPDEVRALLEESLEIRTETFGPDEDRTDEVRDELASLAE